MWQLAGSLSGLWGGLFLTLWERAPTPERARRLHRGTVAKVLARCKIRKRTAEEVVGVLRQPVPVVAPGVTGPLLVEPVGERTGEGDGPRDRRALEELPAALGEAATARADPAAVDEGRRADSPFGEAGDLLVGGTFEQTRAYLGAADHQEVRRERDAPQAAGVQPSRTKRALPLRNGRHRRRSRLPATKGGGHNHAHPQNPRGPAPEDLPRHGATRPSTTRSAPYERLPLDSYPLNPLQKGRASRRAGWRPALRAVPQSQTAMASISTRKPLPGRRWGWMVLRAGLWPLNIRS